MSGETKEALDDITEGLSKSREVNGVCPPQRTGTELDGSESTYCLLETVECEHRGKPRCYDDGNFNLLNYCHCRYEGRKE